MIQHLVQDLAHVGGHRSSGLRPGEEEEIGDDLLDPVQLLQDVVQVVPA